MSSSRSYPMETYDCDQLPLSELSSTLGTYLSKYYGSCEVSVVDCPDLSKEPFNLAGSGLGGKTAIADIGGVPYMMPMPIDPKPIYSFVHLGQKMGKFRQRNSSESIDHCEVIMITFILS